MISFFCFLLSVERIALTKTALSVGSSFARMPSSSSSPAPANDSSNPFHALASTAQRRRLLLHYRRMCSSFDVTWVGQQKRGTLGSDRTAIDSSPPWWRDFFHARTALSQCRPTRQHLSCATPRRGIDAVTNGPWTRFPQSWCPWSPPRARTRGTGCGTAGAVLVQAL